VTLHLDRRVVRATVTVGAKHFRVRRRHGRLVAAVDFSGRRAGTVTVRIRGRRADGHRLTTTRRFRLCARRHQAGQG